MNSYDDEDMIAISALTHYAHCPRRFALTHIEHIWEDNLVTVQGHLLHGKTDSGLAETRGELKIVRSLRLSSHTYGISGVADVVEFHKVKSDGIPLPHNAGLWRPFPIEYKRGASLDISSYQIQLCAQAFCLEEMLNIPIFEGALYSGIQHQRIPILFSDDLRNLTIKICREAHHLLDSGITPLPVKCKHCSSCSLNEYCSPIFDKKSVRSWLDIQLLEALQ